jgi:hypothetical protein
VNGFPQVLHIFSGFILYPKSLKYNSTMKIKFIVVLSIILVSGMSSASFNDAFLDNINDVVLMEFSDGSLYRGQVGECVIDLDVTSCMHGKGIYTFKAGSKYMGEFLNNKPSGKGLFRHADGQTYEGDFQDGFIEGYGVMVYPNGIRYEGGYKKNKREGFGVMTFKDAGMYEKNSRYEGLWKNDRRMATVFLVMLMARLILEILKMALCRVRES